MATEGYDKVPRSISHSGEFRSGGYDEITRSRTRTGEIQHEQTSKGTIRHSVTLPATSGVLELLANQPITKGPKKILEKAASGKACSRSVHAIDASTEAGKESMLQAFVCQCENMKSRIPLDRGLSHASMDDETILLATLSAVHEIMRGGSGGIIIIVVDTRAVPHLKTHSLDQGNLTTCLHEFAPNIHSDRECFVNIISAFCSHGEGDRWSVKEIEKLKKSLRQPTISSDSKLEGACDGLKFLPKDGAIVISHWGDVVEGACHLHYSTPGLHLIKVDGKTAGTRHGSSMALTDWMGENNHCGCVFVRSDDGGAHALLPRAESLSSDTCHSVEAYYFKCVEHLSQADMIKQFKDRIVQKGRLQIRTDNVLARPAKDGEVMLDTINGSYVPAGPPLDSNTWIVRQLTPKQKDYPMENTRFMKTWAHAEDLDDTDLPMIPKVKSFLKQEGWKVYSPSQKMIRYLYKITKEDIEELGCRKYFTKWNATQHLVEGWYLCMPQNESEIYRMAADTVECCYSDYQAS